MRELSIILPVYAETDSVRRVVEGLYLHLGEDIEEIILVVHHASPRETLKICGYLREKHPEVWILIQESDGLGNAVREGLAAARAPNILMMDSDGEMMPETAARVVGKLRSGDYDVVVASRWMRGGGALGYRPPKRFFVYLFNAFFRFLFGTPIHDLSLGFKAMRTEVAKSISWEGLYHEIAAETTLRPIRAGYRVGEVPTVWVCRSGVSKNRRGANLRYVRLAFRVWRGK